MTEIAGATATPQAPISTDAAPAAPPAPASYDWGTSGLDADSMATVTTKGWKSPADTVTSYRQLESVIGVPPERVVKLPKDADPKAWNEVYTKLGRPETADKYVIPVPEGDKGEFANQMKPLFHEAGLSQSQVTALSTKWNAMQAEAAKSQKMATESKNATDIADLKQSWGGEFEAKSALVDRAAETLGMSQAHLDALKQTMGPKAAMEFLHNIGAKVGVEDRTVPGINGQGASFGNMSPDQARAKIEEYKRPGSGFAQLLHSKDPKQRMDAQAEMNLLQQLAFPGSSPVPMSSAAQRR